MHALFLLRLCAGVRAGKDYLVRAHPERGHIVAVECGCLVELG